MGCAGSGHPSNPSGAGRAGPVVIDEEGGTLSADLERVIASIVGSADERVAFARDLVAVPTENPPGKAYPACVDVLTTHLERLGLPWEALTLGPDRAAVMAGVGTGRTLYLHGHYDVVPASRPGQFDPKVADGRLVGRGSGDMKGGIAAMACALAALREVDLPGRVELVVVPDEETGGAGGSRRLAALQRLGRNGVGAILAEPTSGVIWNASRGAVTLRVTVRGRPAHVGLHFRGANAFEGALPVLAALDALKRQVETRRTSFAVEPDAARASILMLGGEVAGGHQFNVVPDRFSFTVERRFNPEEDLDTERARLLETIGAGTPDGVDLDVEVLQEASSGAVVDGDGLVASLSAAVEAVTGGSAACRLCPGLLETRFYAEVGVPAVAYGPGELELAHGPEESVSIGRLSECAEIYARAALALLGAGM
jgi:acetylornithine deacetylase/succinyl-diaminopimelate desuccinylase family protein